MIRIRLLQFLEQQGLLASAADIERKAVQAGRTFMLDFKGYDNG